MDYKGQKMAARNTFIINPKGEIAKVYNRRTPQDRPLLRQDCWCKCLFYNNYACGDASPALKL